MNDFEPPIQNLDTFDIVGQRHDGGVDVVVVCSGPLDDSVETLSRLNSKIRNYLKAILSESFRRQFGADVPVTSLFWPAGWRWHGYAQAFARSWPNNPFDLIAAKMRLRVNGTLGIMRKRSCVLIVVGVMACGAALAAEPSAPQPRAERCPLAPRPLPRSLQEAVDRIVKELDSDSRATLLKTKRDDLILFHHGWGTGIRNSMCLWGGNESLIRSACGGKLCHPDDASMQIMEAVWDRLHAPTK